jgi:hypothetical protein
MSSNFKKFTLAAGLVLSLGYLVGCGTRGENTGFGENRGGGGAASLSNSAAAAGTGGNLITGGTSGTGTVNDAFPLTVVTGLTVSNMLSTAGGSGNSNPPTRLGVCNLTNLPGQRVVAVQGFGVAGQGRVVIMPRNPESVPGTSNVVLNPTGAGSDASAVQNLNNPFGLLVDGQTIYITDNSTNPAGGRIMVYDTVESTGVCRGRQILTTPPLANPVKILKDGNFLYVAENQPRGAGGRIRKIDLTKPFTGDPTNSFILIDNVNNPTSMAFDKSSGRNLLYIAENGASSATGAQGGIARVNLNTSPFNAIVAAVPVGTLTTLADPAVASPGVTFISAGTTAFNFPFDIAADAFGNVVTTEGVQAATVGLVNPNTITGRIRVIPGTVTGGNPGNSAVMVLQNAPPGSSVGVTASRGVSLNAEDSTGTILSAFFTEGSGLTTTLRQLTFRTSDGAIFRHLQLDSGKIAPLDTLFDAGDTGATPVIRPNVKYTVGSFNGGANGAILDIR